MLDGRPPRYVTSFVFHSLDLACRVGGPEILIGEKDGLAIRRCACMGATPCRSILTPLSATQWRKASPGEWATSPETASPASRKHDEANGLG